MAMFLSKPVGVASATDSRMYVVPPTALSRRDRDCMFALMDAHFMNMQREQFESDLSEKDWVFTIRDAGGEVLGFSTLCRFDCALSKESCEVLFSGDTMLHPRLWGRQNWLRVWSRYIWQCASESLADRVYFLLLTANHRTYRLLPALFQTFFPRPEMITPPAAKEMLDRIARAKCGDAYDAARGIATGDFRPVRTERVALVSHGANDSYSEFFRKANPSFLDSEYLVCLTELDITNLTSFGRRLFRV